MKAKKIFWWLFFGLNLGVICFFWWDKSGGLFSYGQASSLLSLGRVTGLLAVFFVLTQLFIMARVRPLERVFAFDRLTKFHHYNGMVSYLFIILHPILLVFSYGKFNELSYLAQVWDFIQNYEDIIPAILSVVLFTLVVIYSILITKRRWNYELWYFVHLSVYVAVLFAFGHQLELGGDFDGNNLFQVYWMSLYGVVFLALLYYRLLYPLRKMFQHQFNVQSIVPETHDVYSIQVTGKDLSNYIIKPGQYMSFRFLSKQFWWQAHMFSVSRIEKDYFQISVKILGDFTEKIKTLEKGTKIFIEGPFGQFISDRAVGDKFLFIAGGIGIAPINCLIDQLSIDQKDMVLVYGNKTVSDIAFKQSLETLQAQNKLRIHHILSQEKIEGLDHGRIDEKYLRQSVPDFLSRDIYLCGPTPMMNNLLKLFKDLGMDSAKIHYEKFSL